MEEAGDEAVEAEVDAVEVEKEGQVGQDELGVEAEVETGEQAEEGVVILSKKMIWNKEWQIKNNSYRHVCSPLLTNCPTNIYVCYCTS